MKNGAAAPFFFVRAFSSAFGFVLTGRETNRTAHKRYEQELKREQRIVKPGRLIGDDRRFIDRRFIHVGQIDRNRGAVG